MKYLFLILLFITNFLFSQVPTAGLPTYTANSNSDLLKIEPASGVIGGSRKQTIANFILTNSISTSSSAVSQNTVTITGAGTTTVTGTYPNFTITGGGLTSTGAWVPGGNYFGSNSTLGNNDNFNLGFETNSSTRMTIKNTGEIGIGITPSSGVKLYTFGTTSVSVGNQIVLNSSSASIDDPRALNIFNTSTPSPGLFNYGIYNEVNGTADNQYGEYSLVQGDGLVHYGKFINVTPSTGDAYGIYLGTSATGASNNTGIYIDASGTGAKAINVNTGNVTLTPLTASRVTALDASKNIITTSVTLTEASYLQGATSNIQTQINALASGTLSPTSINDGTGIDVTGSFPSYTVSVASTYIGQTSIQSVGTLTTGATGLGFTIDFASSTESGVLAIANGGTNGLTQTAGFDNLSPLTTKGDLVAYNGSNNVRLPTAGNGLVLVGDNSQAEGLKWTQLSFTTSVTGVVPVANGGTGFTTATATRIIHATATNTLGENSNLSFDANNNLLVGTTTTSDATQNTIESVRNQATGSLIFVSNNNTGTVGYSGFRTKNSTSIAQMLQLGTGYTTAGGFVQDGAIWNGNGSGGVSLIANHASGVLRFYTGGSASGNLAATIDASQRIGIGITPSAILHLKAGTTAAGTAPLKLSSGSLMTTPETGSLEFLTDKFYWTITTSTKRVEVTLNDAALVSGRVPFCTTNGRLTSNASLTSNGTSLTVGSNTSTYQTLINSITRPLTFSMPLSSSLASCNFDFSTDAVLNISTYNDLVQSDAHIVLNAGGNTTIGITTPTMTAYFQVKKGNTSFAPIAIESGTVTSTVQNGAVEFDGNNFFVSSGGTRYTLAKTLTNTATLEFTSTAAGASTDLTITVTGAADGDAVSIGVPNGSTVANGVFTGWVSAANTVTVRFTNTNLVTALDPTSGTFRATVIKY